MWMVLTSRPAARSSSRFAVGYSAKVRRRPGAVAAGGASPASAGAFCSPAEGIAGIAGVVPDGVDEATDAGLARGGGVAAARRAARRVREVYADLAAADDDDAQAIQYDGTGD